MRSGRPLHLALLVAATTCLSGCVAALVPLAAGGALASSARITGGGTEESAPAHDPRTQRALEAVRQGSGIDEATGGTRVEVLPTNVLPAPSPDASAPAFGGFHDFHRAASAFAQGQDGANRKSALLAEAGGMSANTKLCSDHPPAVLIDLDPDGGVLDTGVAPAAAAGLAQALAFLRAQGVDVFWISEQGAGAAGDIRRILRESGLDPQRRDPILLMRYPEDRKQTRRQDLAATHCLVAIAGDSRRDFDEMFDYLRDPNTPTAADPLLGTRWFLTPPPLD